MPAKKGKLSSLDAAEAILREAGAPMHYQELTEPMRKKIREWIKADEPALFDVLGWSVNIMQEQITQENLRLHPADIVIRPNLGHIRGIDFHKAEEMMAIGYEATEKALNNAV